eukprot:733000-Rhodomonas_salina.2
MTVSPSSPRTVIHPAYWYPSGGIKIWTNQKRPCQESESRIHAPGGNGIRVDVSVGADNRIGGSKAVDGGERLLSLGL